MGGSIIYEYKTLSAEVHAFILCNSRNAGTSQGGTLCPYRGKSIENRIFMGQREMVNNNK